MPTFTFPATTGGGNWFSRALRARTIPQGSTDLTPDAPPVGGDPFGDWARARAAGGGGMAGPPAPDTGLLQSITGNITSLQELAAQNEANATAQQTEATGAQREAEAYGTVGAIARENATVEGISGNIKQLQAARSVQRTIGRQRAETAAAGFSNAAGSLDILKSSMQEGYLQDQLIRSQTSINQGGYLEQAAAADASGAGATLSSNAALDLSKSYAAAGQLATANAANQTKALQDYLASTGGVNTPTRQLVASTLQQDPSQPTTLPGPATEADFREGGTDFSTFQPPFRPGSGQLL